MTSIIPPISNAIADVSPIHPPTFPSNKSRTGVSNLSGEKNCPNGVAPLTASTPAKAGKVHVVILTGKLACRKARPNKAGLKILAPKPPKTCLPKTIATTAPRAVPAMGKDGGSVIAKRIPVKIADPSSMVSPVFMILLHAYSATIAAKTATRIVTIAFVPKRRRDTIIAGKSAAITVYIIRGTECFPLLCGAGATIVIRSDLNKRRRGSSFGFDFSSIGFFISFFGVTSVFISFCNSSGADFCSVMLSPLPFSLLPEL